MSNTGRSRRLCVALAALAVTTGIAATEVVPKQVSLILDGKRLIASNARFNRFDELRLNAQERIAEQTEDKAVVIVVTNQRFLAYGVNAGWKPLRRRAKEKLESLSAEDFAVFITTDLRYLNFNGQTGRWGERDTRVTH